MKPVTWLLVLSIILTPCLCRAGGSRREFAVWPTTDEQEMPAIYGDIVVWQQFVAEYGDYDIYIADLNDLDDPLLFIIGDANDQTNPAIYENVVVWQDFIVADGPGDFDIRAADISDPNEALIFVVSDIVDNDERNPAIHGNIVVWEDGPAGDADIFGADITDPDYPMEFPIANFEFDQQSPAVHRTTVVWQDMYFGDWDILAADIWQRNKPADFGVSLLEHEQTNPAISGETIVWQSWGLPTEDNFPGNWDIYAADLSELTAENAGSAETGINNKNSAVSAVNKLVSIEFAITANEAEQTNPAIDAHLIVWQDDRAGNWDIFGYNLTTRQEFQITDEPHDQTNPAISGTTVVWQDSRDGNTQIYAVTLDGPEVAYCRTRLPGDINNDCKVDIADFALMASNWLECHLEPQEACPPR